MFSKVGGLLNILQTVVQCIRVSGVFLNCDQSRGGDFMKTKEF